MYTSVIGKIFLEAYNKKNGTEYNAKSFFDDVYYPLFFDHNKYMMTAGNSPLENPKLSWVDMLLGKKEYETKEQRDVRYGKLIDKISNEPADASIAIGYPSVNPMATTSGQITNIKRKVSEEEIYQSWIGSGFGIRVSGGLCILFSNEQILLDIFDGWKIYREILNSDNLLKGNQVDNWNGQWLLHRYSNQYNYNNPLENFNINRKKKDEILELELKTTWTKVAIAISYYKSYIKDLQMLGYIYSFGRTNITVGFIPFMLTQIRKPIELYKKLFNMDDGASAEDLWGTAASFQRVCETGSIGLQAMEPKGLRDCINKGDIIKYNKDNEEQILKFKTYQVWIMAILNNEELWDKSLTMAKELHAYVCKDKALSTSRRNKVDNIVSSTNKKAFINALTEIVQNAEEKEQLCFMEIAKDINKMPADNVPYFMALIRLHFAATKEK